MKKLFTFVSLVAFASAMYAQDPSKWGIDQNVAEDLGLKELGDDFSGTKGTFEYGRYSMARDLGNVWKGTSGPSEYLPSTYFNNGSPAVFGFYSMGEFDFYQIVKVPAGTYTFRCNGFYREGTPADNFAHMHRGGKFDYGHMYADVLADDKVTVTYANDRVMKTIAESGNHEGALHTTSDWMTDHHDTYVNKEGETIETWCPCCCEGFGKYFAAGKYVNEKKFVLTQDAYVKFGFRKTGAIKEDCLDFGNIEVIYNGPATEENLRDVAQEEYNEVAAQASDMVTELDDAGFPALAELLGNLAGDIDEIVNDAETAQQIDAAKQRLTEAMAAYVDAKEVVLKLADINKTCVFLLERTSFPGIEEFRTAVNNAKDAAAETDAEKIGTPKDYYEKIVNDLAVAHAKYLDSQVITEDKGKDFTTLVNAPWFVNIENTPVDESATGGDFWHLTEETWAGMAWDNDHQGVDAYSKKQSSFNLTDITSDVVISSDRSVKGQWFKYQDHQEGWCENSRLWYAGRLVGFSTGWASTFKNPDRPGIEGVAQRLVGLPNGYYSVSCLVRGWDAIGDYSSVAHKFLGCFAENTKEVRVTSRVSENLNNWWEWQSNANSWDDVETGVISVEDGELLIGGGGSVANVVTGFRLNFLGAQPNFTAMTQKTSDELRAQISEDFFAGDKKKLNELLNSIQYPIAEAAAYDEACSVFKEFNAYLAEVTKKMATYNAKNTLDDLVENWSNPLWNYINTVAGTAETDTYEKVDEYNELANAYKLLNDYYTTATEDEAFNKDATLKTTIENQQAKLSKKLATKAEIDACIASVGNHIHLMQMKSLSAETATSEKGVDVSSLMVNAKLDNFVGEDGKTDVATGWTSTVGDATQNEYGRNNAELWNRNNFTFSQKIYGLPAGDYVLRVNATYRNGGSCTADLLKAFKDNGGTTETWADHNAVVFMKTASASSEAYVKSIYEYNSNTRSFDEVANGRELVEGNIVVKKIQTVLDEYTPLDEVTYEKKNDGDYPFDTRVETKKVDDKGNVVKDADGKEVIESVNYYPSSMYGFYTITQKNPEVYKNEIKITIKDGEILELGFRKDASVGSDWLIFSDFDLEYLSGESFARAFTGVEKVAVDATENGAIFNLAGQKVDGNFKGVVIKNGVKVLNK